MNFKKNLASFTIWINMYEFAMITNYHRFHLSVDS